MPMELVCGLNAYFVKNWEGLTMFARSGCYYGAPFNSYRWVMKGDPLLPTIFFMVSYVVVRHWDTELAGEGFGRAV